MSGVTFDEDVGGDGSTVTDDDNVSTGLRKGGYLTRFVPALEQFVAIALWMKNYIVTSVATIVGHVADAEQAAADAAASIGSINVAFLGTSTSVIDLDTGGASGALVVPAGKAWGAATRIRFASDDGTKVVEGPVTSYVGTALEFTKEFRKGAGTHNDWNISVAGERGDAGIQGDPGTLTSGGDIANTTITGIKVLGLHQELDNGNSGTSKTVIMADGQKQKLTLTGNCALTIDWTGAPIGVYQVRYIQDGTGGRSLTITGVSTSRWINSTTMPGLNTAASGETVHNYFWNGTTATASSGKVGAV